MAVREYTTRRSSIVNAYVELLNTVDGTGQFKSAIGETCLLYTFSEPTRLRRISYAVFCLKKKKEQTTINKTTEETQEKKMNEKTERTRKQNKKMTKT